MQKNIQTHISILEGEDIKQDSAAVKAIVENSCGVYTKANPWVEHIIHKSDNAGLVCKSHLPF